MAAKHPDVVPVIDKWLTANAKKITSFWPWADWRMWARLDLFWALRKELGANGQPGAPYVVDHSPKFWSASDEVGDIVVRGGHGTEHAGEKPVVVILRCEIVTENSGTFEKFRDQYDGDWARIAKMGKVEFDYEGCKVLLVGLSSGAAFMPQDREEFKMDPKPEYLQAGDDYGEVNGWVMEYFPQEDEEA